VLELCLIVLCCVLCCAVQEVDVCEDGRPLQEVWMVLEFCNRGTLSDAIQRGWLLAGMGTPPTASVMTAVTIV
jgi:hypothetical protein